MNIFATARSKQEEEEEEEEEWVVYFHPRTITLFTANLVTMEKIPLARINNSETRIYWLLYTCLSRRLAHQQPTWVT
jgi:hypothetical protein